MIPVLTRKGGQKIALTISRWMQVGLQEAPKKNSIPVLDSVRAFACLIVIWFHIYRIPRDLQLWPTQPFANQLLNTFLFFGKYGVTLFFVLSGFLLFLPFARSLLFEKTWPSTRQFYLRRVFRIMPAYYLSLILIVLLFQPQYLQPQRWNELALFFIFFMDSSSATFKQLNAPFWTLAIEWQYYMLLPLLALGMREFIWRFKDSYRLPMAAACIGVLIGWGLFSRYIGTYFLEQHPEATWLVPRSVLNTILFFAYGVGGKYLEVFGVGMLLSLLFIYAQRAPVRQRVHLVLHRLSPLLWAGDLFCLLAMILWSYNQSYPNTWPFFNHPLFLQNAPLISEFCIALSFGLCILALLFGNDRFKRCLEWFPLRWIGLISYSLYMWHLPLLILCIRWTQSLLENWQPEQAYGIYWLLVLAVIIPFCSLFFKWVEKPGMRLGEQLTTQIAHRNSTAEQHTQDLPLRDKPDTAQGSHFRAKEPGDDPSSVPTAVPRAHRDEAVASRRTQER